MSYYNDVKRVETQLKHCGVNVDSAKEQINSGGPGFFVNYEMLPDNMVKTAVNRVRMLLYSWLTLLNAKGDYKVITKEKSVTVKRKLSPTDVRFGIVGK